jgi:hypothetical protein
VIGKFTEYKMEETTARRKKKKKRKTQPVGIEPATSPTEYESLTTEPPSR